jgi:hypothetical protein
LTVSTWQQWFKYTGALYIKRNNMNERKLLKFRINSEEKLVTIDLTPLKAEGAGLNI